MSATPTPTPTQINKDKFLEQNPISVSENQSEEPVRAVSVSRNHDLDKLFEKLREENSMGTPEENQVKMDQLERDYLELEQLETKITESKKQLKILEEQHRIDTMNAYKRYLEIEIKKACASGKGRLSEDLMRRIHDHFSGFNTKAELEHGRILYEMIVVHSHCQEIVERALLELALFQLNEKNIRILNPESIIEISKRG